MFAQHEYVITRPDLVERERRASPQQDAIGLVTGQETIDDILNAMDAAWKQGPS